MKITIPKQPDSSITEEVVIELGDYTILAGENNSGKTNLIKAIMNHDDLKDYRIIYIPAEETDPEDKETKLSAKSDPFYKLVETILEPIFKTKMFEDLITDFNSSGEKSKFVDGVNTILDELGVKKKKFDVKISQDDLKKDIIIKVTKAIVKDLYNSDIDDVELKNIGTGTRRMIVAALIRYYADSKIKNEEKTLLIFEEPEVYLHPRWKKGLYESLLKLSAMENKNVLITTHDPYFIELGKDQKIYQVRRNTAKKDATEIEEVKKGLLLPYKSDSEINYQIFDIPSKNYFLEIYDYSKRKAGYDAGQSYKDFDQHMFDTYFQVKGVKQDRKDDYANDCMAITRLRHDIAHGKVTSGTPIDLEGATKDIVSFLNQIK